MAFDVIKNVLTKFFADVKDYVSPIGKADKALEDLNKKQKKIQDGAKDTGKAFKSSLGEIADGIGKVIPGFDQIAGGFKKAEGAAKLFGKGTKAAIAATGIGLFIVAISELISAFGELGDKAPEDLTAIDKMILKAVNGTDEWADKIKAQGKALEEVAKGYTNAIGAQEQTVALLKAEGAARQEVFEAETKSLRLKIAQGVELEEEVKLLRQIAILRASNTKSIQDEAKAEDDKNKKKNEQRAKDIEAARLEKALREQGEEAAIAAALLEAQTNVDKANAFQESQDKKTEAGLKDEEAKNKALIQDQDAFNFAKMAHDAKVQADKDDENAALAKLQRLDLERQKEEAKIILMNAGLDVLQDQLVAEFASGKNQKTNAIAMNIINTLVGIGRIWAGPEGNYYVKLAQTIALGAIGAINGMKISKQNFEKPPKFAEGGQVPENGGMITGRRHKFGGVKFRAGGRVNEAEGGEFIVNRKATSRYLPQLQAINRTGLYADGGIVQSEASRIQSEIRSAATRSQTVLVLEDFRRANNRLDVVESLAKI